MLPVCFLMLCPHVPLHANFHRIELGMTRQEVLQILRRPSVAKVTDADRFSIGFTATSHDIMQQGELWRSGTLRLWLVFDKDQRVIGKMRDYDQQALIRQSSKSSKSP